MTNTALEHTGQQQLQTQEDRLSIWTPSVPADELSKTVCDFLDTANSSMGRATHYNSRSEQQAAELQIHDRLFNSSRDLYTALLALPGLTDRSRQIGVKTLLSHSRNGTAPEFLTEASERIVLQHMFQSLPTPRMLKAIEGLRTGSEELNLRAANNGRTRRLILNTLLNSPRLPLWSVKYRRKMLKAFNHAWGKRLASIIRSILAKTPKSRNTKDREILQNNLTQHVHGGEKAVKAAHECVSFILGNRTRMTLPILKSYQQAKKELEKGKKLPLEVLEGIRSTFHPDVSPDEILSLTKNVMTATQKKNVQRRAQKAGIEIKMDPMRFGLIELYLYAFEMGLNKQIEDAMTVKAEQAAKLLNLSYHKIGIVVDASQSMIGSHEQPLRPMASAMATRDVLQHATSAQTIRYVGGQPGVLVQPQGDTAIADAIVEILSTDQTVEAIYILSDGYENAPAGRTAEVMQCLRELGFNLPVFHLNPVFASESGGVRQLDTENIVTMPVQSPEAMGASMLHGMIEAEPLKGIKILVRLALTSGPHSMKLLPS